MIARKVTTGGSGEAPGKPRTKVAVTDEERRRLIEDCAFFCAERFREVKPGSIREQDLRDVAAEIDAAIGARRMRRKKAWP